VWELRECWREVDGTVEENLAAFFATDRTPSGNVVESESVCGEFLPGNLGRWVENGGTRDLVFKGGGRFLGEAVECEFGIKPTSFFCDDMIVATILRTCLYKLHFPRMYNVEVT